MVDPKLPERASDRTLPRELRSLTRDVRRTRFPTVRAGLAPDAVYAFIDDLAVIVDELVAQVDLMAGELAARDATSSAEHEAL